MLFALFLQLFAVYTNIPQAKDNSIVKEPTSNEINFDAIKPNVHPFTSDKVYKNIDADLQFLLHILLINNNLPPNDIDAIHWYKLLWFKEMPISEDLRTKVRSISKKTYDALNDFYKANWWKGTVTMFLVKDILKLKNRRFQ